MPLPIHTLLPLYGFVVTLQFTKNVRINFLHQLALTPFIRYLLDSPAQFDTLIRIDACETGRLFYNVGDDYRFTVYGLSGSEELLQNLIQQLQNLPFSVIKNDKAMPFRRNCRLIALQDAFSEQPITNFYQLCAYQPTDLQEETALWQEHRYFAVHLLSPLRLSKASEQRQNLKREARFCRCMADITAALVAERLYDGVADLLRRRGLTDLPARTAAHGLVLAQESRLFWQDAAYKNGRGQVKACGGVLGELAFCVTHPAAVNYPLWTLGQYTGFGQRTSFGLGRYQLQTADKAVSCRRAMPSC